MVLMCGSVFDGVSAQLAGRTEIAVRDGVIVEMGPSVTHPDTAELIDLARTGQPRVHRHSRAPLVRG